MTKTQSSGSQSKGQKTLFNFGIKQASNAHSTKPAKAKSKTKKGAAAGSDEEDGDFNPSDNVASEVEDAAEEDFEEEEENDAPADTDAKNSKGKKRLDLSLPPISDLRDIFSDIVQRVPQLKDVASWLEGRKLRVATMCSGTESPLLALEMIQEALKSLFQKELLIEHVFSCEIEPFKQAYIERNFRPPILFRDVCELGDDEAHTAYGSLVPVPGDVDLLIAGTSCVDYSNLNGKKKGIDAGGESGRTFNGMLSWVAKHRPPLVILENVCSAPWDSVVKYFEKIKYSATYNRLDTKEFYIPHTRTRGYLIAVDKSHSDLPKRCIDFVKDKKRPASCTIEEFLLPNDHPKIHEGRAKLIKESYNANDRKSGRTDWSKCQFRHAFARDSEALGGKRPATRWQEGGKCKLSSDSWQDWGAAQVERVWDLMDIELLRAAKIDVDPAYKTYIWNLSQNVDRNVGTINPGISPCLTPSMIPFVTNRGGPMIGLEALSLQGLPINKLLLTRETEDNLADLAGNAMSTTVVGMCMLSALIVGKKLLKSGSDTETYAEKKGGSDALVPVDMNVDQEESESKDVVVGEDRLQHSSVDLATFTPQPLRSIIAEATRSVRLCICEGRSDITTRPISRCQECGECICQKCYGHPEHNMEPITFEPGERIFPSQFIDNLSSSIPMILKVDNVDQSTLDAAKKSANAVVPGAIWSKWCTAVLEATNSTLRFVEMRRQEQWTIVYESPNASLEFSLHSQQPEWRLFAKPAPSEPAGAAIRDVLLQPVGRLRCTDALLEGTWSFALPSSSDFAITIEGSGDLVPSWKNRLGLTNFVDKELQWPALNVTVPEDATARLDRDISGQYTLLPRCGTASGALHKRVTSEDDGLPPIFLFLDPDRISTGDDPFVFSISKRRYEHNEARPLICKIQSSWRPADKEGAQQVQCRASHVWISSDKVQLSRPNQEVDFGVPNDSILLSASDPQACGHAHAVLTASVDLRGQAGREWQSSHFKFVTSTDEASVYRQLSWLLEPARRFDGKFFDWHSLPPIQAEDLQRCETCAPSIPKIRWRLEGSKIVPFEDPSQAGSYERRIKSRPSPFVTQLCQDESGTGHLQIGLNIPTLFHRAVARLPIKNRDTPVQFSWRLNTNYAPSILSKLPKFTLKSNKQDPQHSQPPHFKLDLRPEQLRSLDWMIRREAPDAEPFYEEEVAEACLLPIGWRVEGQASRAVLVRGGVLADQVGYGKTAVTLGLMDCTQKAVKREFQDRKPIHGKILSPATLIVVPSHLPGQWGSEIKKFLGNSMRLKVLHTKSDLNKLSIEDVMNADVVVVSSSMFKSDIYLDNLTNLAGSCDLPRTDGRHFNAKLEETLTSLKNMTQVLMDQGAAKFKSTVQKSQKTALDAEALEAELYTQSKRLKGKRYHEAAMAADAKKVGTEQRKIKPMKAKPNSKGLVPEVVLDSSSSSSPTATTSSRPESPVSTVPTTPEPDDDVEMEDADATAIPRKRVRSAKAIIISDDEDNMDVDSAPRRKPKRSRVDSDEEDYAEGSGDDLDDEVEEVEDEDSDGEPVVKPKAKKPAPRRSSLSSEASDAKPTKKRKSTGGDEPAKKKPKTAPKIDHSQRWGVDSKQVQRDWTQMKSPALEMFHFARVVVDEYTYLEGKILSLVTNLTSDRKWVLSGTPPVHDFTAVRTISAFLNVHLGIPEDVHTRAEEEKRDRQKSSVNKFLKDLSPLERFSAYIDVPTVEWQMHRQKVGQGFLDMFVRQNIAEIDEIPMSIKKVDIALPASEFALYLELEHHLRAQDMVVKKAGKGENDRQMRLNESLGESNTAEEALLKACSHFRMDVDDKHAGDNAVHACDLIVSTRQKQLDNCKKDLTKALQIAVKMEKSLARQSTDETSFNVYIGHIRKGEGVDDMDAQKMVLEIFDEAGVGPTRTRSKRQEDLSDSVKEDLLKLREATHEIRRLTKELCGRLRSLRYFRAVRDLQRETDNPVVVDCAACGKEGVPVADAAVLSSCGHKGCLDCVTRRAAEQTCVDSSCKSNSGIINIVKAGALGQDSLARDASGKHFGRKLERVVEIIQKEIPKKDRILVFVQFPDLMNKVRDCLEANGIKAVMIEGNSSKRSKNLTSFQENTGERVLLLNAMNESASGANLTNANHAIFISPLLAPSKEIYDACETQAIGRVRRYGQLKHVVVWQCVTANTIDQEIYLERQGAAMQGI